MKSKPLFLFLLFPLLWSCDLWADLFSPDPPGEFVISETVSRNLSPGTDNVEAFVTENADLSFTLLRRFTGGSVKRNIFFSPYSISLALAMTYAGAGGDTEREFQEVLGFLPQDSLHKALNGIDLLLNDEDKETAFLLEVVNSLWIQKDYPVLPVYLDLLAENYGAGINRVDFISSAEYYREEINDWIAKMTRNRIKDLLPKGSVGADTPLVITNAIYFKSDWLSQFKKRDTRDGSFYLQDGSEVLVPMMNKTTNLPAIIKPGEYSAVEILYEGSEISAVFVVPEREYFDQFLEDLSSQDYWDLLSGLNPSQINLFLPKFSYTWEGSLSNTLKALGMIKSFTPGEADFSGIDGTEDLFISDIFHKAFVAVDEKGTEAAAATAVVIGVTSAPPAPAEIRFDRPFLYFIIHRETRQILFMGTVFDPR